MKRGSPNRFRAIGLIALALACTCAGSHADAQADQTQSAQLLSKAHALEVRGRIDMAKQVWQQVLLGDPSDAEALTGMARAEKLEGHPQKSAEYLDKLRAINPNDPNIARVETMGTSQDRNSQLQEAGRLAQQGQYARAMEILRQVYGDTPPPGDAAISYYQTEAASEEGRPHAIAGLRALVDKYPQDSRYQIVLGKILTYNPRTRAEGRRLLEKHPNDPEAVEALRASLLWDAQNPATAADIRTYLAQHKDQQLATALAQTNRRTGGRPTRELTPEEQAALEATRARSAEEQAAYSALAAKHVDEAEAKFKAILANNPKDTQALAGLGYVRMSQSNFGGAISYLEEAEQAGDKDPAVEKALRDSRFYYTMQAATTALNENDLVTAQQQFTAAEQMRPADTQALLGLGGTLLKAQQPDAAIPVFAQYVKMAPGDRAAWRGLFMAQYGATKYNDALATDKRVPPKVKAELLRDPDYLRTLASVYSALGRDADAQRVLRSALDLPFPADASGLKAGVQLQYAALLSAANHRDQAVGLYRQVLAGDPSNAGAYIGLVSNEHDLQHDAEAYQTIQSMPPDVYAQAMQEAGFETTVAAIYGDQGHPELAQDVLEKFIAKQQTEGKKPFVPAEIQLAGIYLQKGDSAKAYPLYSSILQSNPERADAWDGLLSALHATGHDQEAIAQLQAMPPATRRELENDPVFLQTVGSIYAGVGDSQEAMLFFTRVQQHYVSQHVAPPADIDIQEAWLLYNSGNDATLYRQLMMIGSRDDLTDAQRLTVQTIWTNWAVRRANQASKRGDYRRAIAILNATATTFPGNPVVVKALASGYAAAGMPKEAVAIFRSQDLNTASAADYKAAIGAALAANDMKDAETWLRFGLDQYPRDPQMLVLAGKFEQARGDANRAAEYYRASLSLMPVPDPGAELSAEMARPAPQTPVRLPSRQQPQDLATLLGTPDTVVNSPTQQPMVTRPYLPGYNGATSAPPVSIGSPNTGYTTGGGGAMGSPQNNSYPGPGSMTPAHPSTGNQPAAPRNSTLKDYVPQSLLQPPSPKTRDAAGTAAIHLHPSPEMEAKYGPYVVYDPAVSVPHFASASFQLGDGAAVRVKASGERTTAHIVAASYEGQQTASDGTPVVSYVPNATSQAVPPKKAAAKRRITSRPANASVRAQAAAIRANQADAAEVMTGQSHPPPDSYDVSTPAYTAVSPLQNAQYATPAYSTGQQAQPPQAQMSGPYSTSAAAQQSGGSYGQQYPQPRTGTANATGSTTRRRRHAATPPADQPAQAPQTVTAQAPLNYPAYAPPLEGSGPPQVGAPYPMGQAPTDYELQQRNLPPLRGYYYDPRTDNTTPLTERQQTELDLETIQGSYSGWIGGSVIGRYRSGTPGIDRLSTLEVPFEASVVVNNALRLSIIPEAVFLNNGQLNTSGLSPTVPILGSLYGGTTANPQQQFASGVGGEFQLATNTFSAAIGFTPYEFLVTNVIGRVRWRPSNGHFTFYGGRDPVKETELSYAGLRDPGSATTTYGGNVWGGVVQTGGGVRFDAGNERAGLYLSGEGADLSGYHVLDNRKFDGTMGAYFRVKNWPEYGSLNVGGLFFGEHFSHNELGETYGLGGYFSPEAYFLAAVPVTFSGHYGTDIHYFINGSVGIQTFQEDNQPYFPLDSTLEGSAVTACVTGTGSTTTVINRTCGQDPSLSNTGLNYAIDSELSYRVNEHWYVGAFFSANNTNNYNMVQGGFFGRYTFRPEYPTADYPTGLFPVEGFRPLRVP